MTSAEADCWRRQRQSSLGPPGPRGGSLNGVGLGLVETQRLEIAFDNAARALKDHRRECECLALGVETGFKQPSHLAHHKRAHECVNHGQELT